MNGVLRCYILVAVLVGLTLGSSSESSREWYFCETPADVTVLYEGGSGFLKCNGCPGDVGLVFSWHEPTVGFSTQKGIEYGNSSVLYMDGPYLVFPYVTREWNRKWFRCEAKSVSDKAFSVVSSSAEVIVYWIDEESSVRRTDSLSAGQRVTLHCAVTGNPTPTIVWYKNRNRLYTSPGLVIHSDGSLVISSLDSTAAGVYTCMANNSVGSTQLERGIAIGLSSTDVPLADLGNFITEVIGKKDSTLTLQCPLSDKPSVLWTTAGKNAKNFDRNPDGSLTIRLLKKVDEGIYECYSSGHRETSTYAISVHMAKLRRFDSSSIHSPYLNNSKIIVGSNRTWEVMCAPTGSFPKPTVEWLLNGELIGASSVTVGVTSGMYAVRGKLIVNSASTRAQGILTCQATNVAGERMYNVSYFVTVRPNILENPQPLTVEEGLSATFSCVYEGNRSLSAITWVVTREKDEVIKPNQAHITISSSGQLRFDPVTSEDAGTVFCRVTTSGQAPVVSSHAQLRVTKVLKFSHVPTDRLLELGGNEDIRCQAEAETTATVSWMYLGPTSSRHAPRPLLEALPLEKIAVVDGTLVLRNITKKMGGVYMCAATSSPDVINVSITITVGVPPLIPKLLTNTAVYAGYDVTFVCNASGDPLPRVEWRKDNNPVVSMGRYKVSLNNRVLEIKNASSEDAGAYSCLAGSSMGFARSAARLWVKPIPSGGLPVGVPPGFSVNFTGHAPGTSDGLSLQNTIIIAVTSAVLYLILVIIMTVWCSARLVKKKKALLAQEAKRAAERGNGRIEEGTMEATERDCLVENGSGMTRLPNGLPNGHTKAYPMVSLNSPGDVPPPSSLATISSHKSSSSGRSGVGPLGPKSDFSGRSIGGATARTDLSGSGLTAVASDLPVYSRVNLELIGLLGKGVYGDVLLAKAPHLLDDGSSALVYVKALSSGDEKDRESFREEAYMYSKVNHNHVSRFYALCTEVEPMYMLVEYCEWGDLKQFLLAASRSSGSSTPPRSSPPPPPPSCPQRLSWLHQISLAMTQLSKARLVHSDLAARNILLMPSLQVKVANLALTRDVYAREYACIEDAASGTIARRKNQRRKITAAADGERVGLTSAAGVAEGSSSGGGSALEEDISENSGRRVPLRWAAPEACCTPGEPVQFTRESDVWSFGVLAWEIFADGRLPYSQWSDARVYEAYSAVVCGAGVSGAAVAAIGGGPGASQRDTCSPPEGLLTVMEQCWAETPADRPGFSEVTSVITDVISNVVEDTDV